MRSRVFTTAIATAALISTSAAGNAPAVTKNPIADTLVATISSESGVSNLTGVVQGAGAPNGDGTNFQVIFHDLPSNGGNLTYGIYTDRISGSGCSSAGAILNPFAGATGSACKEKDPAACAIGDLSDKHGQVPISEGGSGTGYFAGNYVDGYLSLDPSSKSFFGHGSLVVMDASGTALACANFVNASVVSNATSSTMTASATSSMATLAASSSASTSATSTSSSAAAAARTAFAGSVGAGMLGLAAAFL